MSNDNKQRYWMEMSECIKDTHKNDNKEARIRDRIATELDGTTEVTTLGDYIDIVTADMIIEVKEISKWKHAMGQILAYGYEKDYESHNKRIHLFYENNNEKAILDHIINVCKRYNCIVAYEKV